MKIVDYMVVIGFNALAFENSVKLYLKSGWVPQGGLTVDSGRYYQSMVKYEKTTRK